MFSMKKLNIIAERPQAIALNIQDSDLLLQYILEWRKKKGNGHCYYNLPNYYLF